MKKRIFRKGICAGLILAMVMGLCACGGGGKGTQSADPSLAKQFVFSSQELDISGLGDDMGIRSVVQKDDRIYLIAEIYHWNEAGSENEVKLLSTKLDGTDIQIIDLQKPESGEADNEADVEAGTEDEVTPDADEPAQDEDVSIDDGMLVDPGFGVEARSGYEYTGYNNYVLTDENKIYAVKNHTMEDYSDPENYVSKTDFYVCAWDFEGNLLWETPIEGMEQTEDQYFYISRMAPAADGSAILLINGDPDVFRVEVSTDGTLSERQKLTKGAEIMLKANEIVPNPKDGTLLITYYNDEWTKMYLASYDPKTDTVVEETELPQTMMNSGMYGMTSGASSDIVYPGNNGLYSYTKGDTEAVQIMDYINSDLNASGFNSVVMLDDEHFVGAYYDNAGGKQKVAIFTKRNPEDIPDKTVLVVAGNYVGYDLKNRIFKFNKESELYRIVVKEYNSYNNAENWNAGFDQLNNDIIAGNMPDILVGSDYLPMDTYISKGLVADIGKLIAEDEELSQKEFLQNVFNAYSKDEKLYYVIPSFYVRSMMGKTSFLQDRTTWTMKEFQEFSDSLPEGTQVFGDLTRDYFMYMVMQYCGNDYIDVATGKCKFDSEEFIAMLEYAKTLPVEINHDYETYDWNEYQTQYREDRTVLMELHFSSFFDQTRNMNGYFGEDVSFIGFPTDSGKGSVLMANEYYAISSKSKNLDGAWEFVRYYLTDEYQETLRWGLPVSKEVFMTRAQEATKRPYYLDENGEKVEYDDYFDINGESVILDPLTQEQVDQLVALVESVEKKSYMNQDIENIIQEEAAAFFEDQKSAKDVAQIIQSRAQIFVDEHR